MRIRSLLQNLFGRKCSSDPESRVEPATSDEAAPSPEEHPGATSEPKPVPTTDTPRWPTLDPKPATTPEPKPEPTTDTPRWPTLDPKPATTPEPKPVPTTDTKSEPEPEPERPTPDADAEPVPAPAADTGTSRLAKVEAAAPGLVSLYKTAAVSLEKHGLAGQRAAVYLVLDRSGSMRRYYKDGTVQHLAEQVLGLSANLDDDGTVPVVFFSTDIDGVADIDLTNYAGRTGELHDSYGHMGRTNYHLAIDAVVAHYEASGATDPALVIFQTDGAPSSKPAAERALCAVADKPLFWQFIGFGDPRSAGLNFLRKLDNGLPVPEKRTVDNAGFFHAGLEPRELTDADLYDALTAQFPKWLTAAKEAGILR
jgi:vWA found in TerF C terminus